MIAREGNGSRWSSENLNSIMAIKSVYLREPVIYDAILRIRDEEHRHLSVARTVAGEVIEIFDGRGTVWKATVTSVERRETLARIDEQRQAPPDIHQLVLGLSMIRPAAFELALEKAVETGVSRIIPVLSSRSNVKDAGRRDRFNRIIVEAAKQSKRYYLPVVDEPVSFANVITMEAPTKIVFAERNGRALKPAIKGSPALYLV